MSSSAEWSCCAVPLEHLPGAFHLAQPLLLRAIEYSDGELTIADLIDQLACGNMTLWLVGPGVMTAQTADELAAAVRAAMVTEIGDYPAKRVLQVALLGGEDVQRVVATVVPALRMAGEQRGCHQIRVVGRRGWARSLADWRQLYVTMGLDIGQPVRKPQPDRDHDR